MTDTREFVTSPNCPGVISQTPFLPVFNDLLNFGVQRSDDFRSEPEHSSGQWFSLHFVWKWLTQTPFLRVIRTEFSLSRNRHLQRVFLSTSHSSRSHDSPSWPIKDRLMCASAMAALVVHEIEAIHRWEIVSPCQQFFLKRCTDTTKRQRATRREKCRASHMCFCWEVASKGMPLDLFNPLIHYLPITRLVCNDG